MVLIKKKAFLVIIILIAAGVTGVLIYFIFLNSQTPTNDIPCWYGNPIRINEVLYNPSQNSYGDANGDEVFNSSDEFIEIVCMNATFDFNGCELYQNFVLIHTFPEGSIVPAGGAIVVFGGGNPKDFFGGFGGAVVQVANGVWNDLNDLNDDGATITLKRGNSIIDNITYYGGEINQSITRASDICGEFKPHSEVSSFNFTPGSDINGDSFQLGLVINEVLCDAYEDINGDGDFDIYDDEFVEFVNNFGEEFDFTGCELYDKDGLMHNFSTGPVIQSGGALVIFGGGNRNEYTNYFGGATVLNASDWTMLSNSREQLSLIKNGIIIAVFSHDNSIQDQSFTRYPDIIGTYIPHLNVSLSACSPGTRTDGTPFI